MKEGSLYQDEAVSEQLLLAVSIRRVVGAETLDSSFLARLPIDPGLAFRRKELFLWHKERGSENKGNRGEREKMVYTCLAMDSA